MTVQNFTYGTATSQAFVVPTGVTTITMEVNGASGGDGSSGATGGLGGYVKAQIDTTPGETLRVFLGQMGVEGQNPNWTGGGGGGNANDRGIQGGGGTDVRRSPYGLGDRLIVGAGGGAASINTGRSGGNGGYANGADGAEFFAGGRGRGATQSAGGAAGFMGGEPSNFATAGTLGLGGEGYPEPQISGAIAEGGGGGGGYYGGGGGSEASGGGGGSGYASMGYVTSTDGAHSGDGSATFTYTVSEPTTFTAVQDVPFLQANDRYQVVACVKAGTSTTTSQFRYWYSGAPEWDLALNSDSQYPPFHTLDENQTYPDASVEMPFKSLKTGQEDQIQGVYVEFYARPTSLTETTVTSTYSVGFTCRVEGVSTPNYSRNIATTTVTTLLTSGIIVSDDQTYTSTAQVHASDTWPNLRTVFLPCRMPGKIRAARVILSDIHLVAIRRVQLMGKLTPGRDA